MNITIPPTEAIIGIIAVLAIVAVAGGWIYLKFFGSR
jgi:hypothetical protein